MDLRDRSLVLDYRALRLVIGVMALAMPFAVSLLAETSLSSISASYYTGARNVYLGMLFVVGALFWAYNGHSAREAAASRVAAVASITIALCPSACPGCEPVWTGTVHYVAAGILFAILAYFCFLPFRRNTRGKKGKPGRRSMIYFVCGWVMVSCMLVMLVANLTLSDAMLLATRITYWTEAVALVAFGIAWITAGKIVRPLVDREEALRLLPKSRRHAGSDAVEA